MLPLRHVGIVLAAALGCAADELPAVLAAKCGGCHGVQTKASGFVVSDLASVKRGGKKFGAAIQGGHPESSVLVKMLRGEVTPRMPVGGEPLTAEEIASVETWIRGLPAEKSSAKSEWRWPYEKPKLPVVPAASGGRNDIDKFLLARLRQEKLQFAPEASKVTLARRAYLDLIGLPPTPEDLNAFLKDGSADSYEKLIERLLEDPRYGERWGRHWLDLVRYGETSGLEGDGAIGNAWRYRDWVIDAFQRDMPYDRFVIAQLAGADEHSKTRNNYAPNVQGHVPLGYLRLAPWDRSNLVADEVRQNYLSEVTSTTASVFLGLTMGCARCHDHKYDPIPQKDFYRLQAFFNAIQVENVEVPYKDPEFKARADAAIAKLEAALKDGPEKRALDAFEKEALPRYRAAKKAAAEGKKIEVEDLRLEMRRKDSPIFTAAERRLHAELKEDADRTLDAEERAALDAFEKPMLERLRAAAPSTDRFDVLTVEEMRQEFGRANSKIFSADERTKYTSLAETVDTLRRRLNRWKPLALTVKNVPGPPAGPFIAPTRILVRGDYRQPGDAVEAGFPTAITGAESAATIEQDRYRQFPTRGWRITLAKWIASKDNPLTARVMVNRLWQQHFGTGIVATPSDFGVNGERPTHPELLDWLAHQFVESGWSVKAMHRLMMTSAAYRQSAENPASPDGKLFSSFSRRRLSAEEIRDSLLYLSGRLNPERGGPSVFPPLPADLADFARYGRGGAAMWETNEKEEDARRRSVYTFHRRSMPLPMMAAFDAPVFSESCDRRSSTTTPLQALSMMNGDLIHAESKAIAELVKKETGPDDREQLTAIFRRVLLRDPNKEERSQFAAMAGRPEAVARVLLQSNEFLYVE